jgi:2'-5' RNA ligase
MNQRVLVAPVTGVDQLAGSVSAATRELGSQATRKRFVGHISLARLRRNGRNMPRILGALIQAEWTVDEVALVQSTLHPDGARYDTLETWHVPTG